MSKVVWVMLQRRNGIRRILFCRFLNIFYYFFVCGCVHDKLAQYALILLGLLILLQVTSLMSSAAFLVACHMCTYINKVIVCNPSCWQIKYNWSIDWLDAQKQQRYSKMRFHFCNSFTSWGSHTTSGGAKNSCLWLSPSVSLSSHSLSRLPFLISPFHSPLSIPSLSLPSLPTNGARRSRMSLNVLEYRPLRIQPQWCSQ